LARGRLVPYPAHAAFGVPSDAESLLGWPGLSWRGRLRAATDLYRKSARGDGDESLGDLVTRRLGRECADVLVGPILAGIHAGDPNRLSVRATFPELRSWEVKHGSLIRGSRAARLAAREKGGGPLFHSLKGGLGPLAPRRHRIRGPRTVAGHRRRQTPGSPAVDHHGMHMGVPKVARPCLWGSGRGPGVRRQGRRPGGALAVGRGTGGRGRSRRG